MPVSGGMKLYQFFFCFACSLCGMCRFDSFGKWMKIVWRRMQLPSFSSIKRVIRRKQKLFISKWFQCYTNKWTGFRTEQTWTFSLIKLECMETSTRKKKTRSGFWNVFISWNSDEGVQWACRSFIDYCWKNAMEFNKSHGQIILIRSYHCSFRARKWRDGTMNKRIIAKIEQTSTHTHE